MVANDKEAKKSAKSKSSDYQFEDEFGSDDIEGNEESFIDDGVNEGKSVSGNLNWFQKNKRLASALVAVVVLLLGYSLFSSNKNKTSSQIYKQPTARVSQVNNDQLLRTRSAVEQNQQKVNKLSSTLADNTQSVQQLQQQVSDLHNEIIELKTSLVGVNQALSAETDRLQSLSSEVSKPGLKRVAKKAVVHYPVYHLKAIVPGRAWIQAANGDDTTVRIGDRVAGYGRVVTISPDNGAVAMSSGKIITYGTTDS